jgi:hypothetical protein
MTGTGDVSHEALEEWIWQNWPNNRPPWPREEFVRQFLAEREYAAKHRAESELARALDNLRARVAAIDRRLATVVAPSGKLNEQFVEAWAKAISDVVRDYVDRKLAEGRYMRFVGVWDEQRTYLPGDVVSYAGSMWCATAAVESGERPGKAAAWRLTAKGADAGRAPTVS